MYIVLAVCFKLWTTFAVSLYIMRVMFVQRCKPRGRYLFIIIIIIVSDRGSELVNVWISTSRQSQRVSCRARDLSKLIFCAKRLARVMAHHFHLPQNPFGQRKLRSVLANNTTAKGSGN